MKRENIKFKGGKVALVGEPSKFEKVKGFAKRNSKRLVAIGLTVVVVGGSLIFYFANKSKGKNNGNGNVVPTPNPTPNSPAAVNKEEEYSRELLDTRSEDFTKEVKDAGIELTEEEVREFAGFMNIDQIVENDPELASELFEGKNAEEVISDAGHMIGTLITNSFKTGKSINLSNLVVGNNYDKAILTRLENYRDELTKLRDEEPGEHRVEFATKEEEEKFDKIIADVLNFYSMTADGLEVKDGETAVIQKMGDGNRFAMVLVMNEIALQNRNLLTDEEYNAFQELMSNEPVVENITKLIEGCKSNQKTK